MQSESEGAEKRTQCIIECSSSNLSMLQHNYGLDRPALTIIFIKKEGFKPTLKIRVHLPPGEEIES